MKRALTLSLAAILSFPLLSEEAPKAEEKAAQPKTETAAPAPIQPGDSPLVQAAKRSTRRQGSTKAVITNASLKKSKGHVTTTTVQRPIVVPPAPEAGPEGKLAEQQAAKAAEEKRLREIRAQKEQKTATRDQRRASAADAAEDTGYDTEDHDPADAEQAANEQKPPA